MLMNKTLLKFIQEEVVNKLQALEGLLFLSGDKGITTGELIMLLNVSEEEVGSLIDELTNRYAQSNSALTIIETAKNYKIVTTKDNYEVYQQYANMEFNDRLSTSALETLAIIAYNQPVTRFMVEETRGVMTTHHFKTLLNKDLIKVVGKSDEVGKPNLYGTTPEFLDFLGINSLDELPPLNTYILDDNLNQDELFGEEEDFKAIRKRLLSEDNFINDYDEQDFSAIDEIEVKDVIIPRAESQLEESEEEMDGE